jgi:hypothetical protein
MPTTKKRTLEPKRRAFQGWFFPVTLVFVLLLVFVFIEFRRPYFFLQDDNRVYYLPVFSHVFRSFMNGELAQYNFHQFLGTPSLASGQSGALYPITYIAVGLSQLIWGHVYASIDILVIPHLIIGGVGTYYLMRFFDIDPKVAWFAGLTWPLSSFVVYASDSWVILSFVAAYFPWILLCSLRLHKRPSLQAMLWVVAVRLLLFYSGHIQFFVYSVIFEFVTTFLYIIAGSEKGTRKFRSLKFLIKHLESYIYVLLLSLPLLLPMWNQMLMSSERSGKTPLGNFFALYFPVDQLLLGLLFPFLKPNKNTIYPFMNLLNLSHIGYLTVILLVFGIVLLIISQKRKAVLYPVKLSIFTIPAILAALWTTSRAFNCVIYLIPILNRFRWSFKLVFFLDFYLIVIAAFTLAVIMNNLPKKKFAKTVLLTIIITVQIVNFSYLYAATPIKSFTVNYDDQLPLEEPLGDKLTPGRILSVGYEIPVNPENYNNVSLPASSFGYNYATLWNLDHFAGYEPMITKANQAASLTLDFTGSAPEEWFNFAEVVEYFRFAGVKWYIVPKSKSEAMAESLSSYGVVSMYEDNSRTVFYDAKAFPMAFVENDPEKSWDSVQTSTNSIRLHIDTDRSETIVFNYIYNPFFKAFIDGQEVSLNKHGPLHMSVLVPDGNHDIVIRYSDPYFNVGIGIAVLFLVSFSGVMISRHYRKKHSKPLTKET